MKTKLLSIVLTAALTLSFGLLGKVGCDKMELEGMTDKLNAELMQANLELGRAETRFGDAHQYASELEEALQKEIKDREAHITRIGKLKARLKAAGKGSGPGEIVYVEGPVDELAPGAIYATDADGKLIRIVRIAQGYEDHRIQILCSADFHEPVPPVRWNILYDMDLTLEADLVETITPSGAVNHYVNIWETEGPEGKRLNKLQLTDFVMITEDQRKAHWFWWAPHLDVGAMFMAGTTPPRFLPGGSLGVSFMGYGLTENDLQWRVLRLSMDLSDGTAGLGFTPALYNMGSFIPLISNLWIGPHGGYSLKGEWQLGIFIGAVL